MERVCQSLPVQALQIADRGFDRKSLGRFFDKIRRKRSPDCSVEPACRDPFGDGPDRCRMPLDSGPALLVRSKNRKSDSLGIRHVLAVAQVLDSGIADREACLNIPRCCPASASRDRTEGILNEQTIPTTLRRGWHQFGGAVMSQGVFERFDAQKLASIVTDSRHARSRRLNQLRH